MVKFIIFSASFDDQNGQKDYEFNQYFTTILAILLKVSKLAIWL